MAEKKITVVHDGVTITYEEESNRWTFELRGRERFSESLAKAKEAIDKPEPVAKKRKFDPIPGWTRDRWSGDKWKSVKVTSVAESQSWRVSVWVTGEHGSREKKDATDIYAANPRNDLMRAEIDDLEKQIEKMQDKVTKLFDKLQRVDLKPFEEPKEK